MEFSQEVYLEQLKGFALKGEKEKVHKLTKLYMDFK